MAKKPNPNCAICKKPRDPKSHHSLCTEHARMYQKYAFARAYNKKRGRQYPAVSNFDLVKAEVAKLAARKAPLVLREETYEFMQPVYAPGPVRILFNCRRS